MVVFWEEPMATDLSGEVTLVSRSHAPGSFFIVGVTTVTYVFADPSGNEYECSFNITVVTGEECHCDIDAVVFSCLYLLHVTIVTF